MRIPLAISGTSLLVAISVGAQQSQQTAGVISHPVASPVFPGIVAYDRIVGDRQELQFIRLSTQQVFSTVRAQPPARASSVVSMPDTNGTTISAYAGQIDWRPVTDRGRSWFAYLASDDRGTVGLMLNYIDGSGQLAKSPAMRIPFAGQARSPRWSPDGNHLAFVSDSSILYIVSDVGAALRAGSAAALRPTRVTAATRPALFPAWSPFGDHIAYGIETVSRGNRNGAIEVLPINKLTGKVAGSPVVVTGELVGDNEYRPSWSPDGKYIAFYADQAGMGGSRQQVSIGIVEVILNSRDGHVFRGEVKEGRQRWLADNVIPDEVRGPAWTAVSDGAQRKDALVYVVRDPSRSNPIVTAGLQRFLDQLPREQYEVAISSTWDAVNPKSVSSAEMLLKMRIVYTSVKGGGEVVSYHDAVATWANGPEPEPVVVAGNPTTPGQPASQAEPSDVVVIYAHKGKDVGQALLFPGLGQFSAGERPKGMFLTAAGIGGALIAAVGYSGMSGPLNDGKVIASKDPLAITDADRATFSSLQSSFNSKKTLFMTGGAVFAAAYIYGILDVAVGRAAPASGLSFQLTPQRVPGERSPAAQLGFTIPVGTAPR